MQAEPGAASLGFINVGQDLEEQQELLECLLAFYTQYLLADDSITCLRSGDLFFLHPTQEPNQHSFKEFRGALPLRMAECVSVQVIEDLNFMRMEAHKIERQLRRQSQTSS